jgi:hypothetical protein
LKGILPCSAACSGPELCGFPAVEQGSARESVGRAESKLLCSSITSFLHYPYNHPRESPELPLQPGAQFFFNVVVISFHRPLCCRVSALTALSTCESTASPVNVDADQPSSLIIACCIIIHHPISISSTTYPIFNNNHPFNHRRTRLGSFQWWYEGYVAAGQASENGQGMPRG